MRTKTCRICLSAGDVNDEDVLPRWLRSAARPYLTSAQLPPRALLPICRSHNSFFGRELENKVAPWMSKMIANEPVELDVTMQSLLVSWEIKTSLMMDLWHLDQVRRGFHQPGSERRPREFSAPALLSLENNLTSLDHLTVVRIAALDLSPQAKAWPVRPHPATGAFVTGLTNLGPVLLEIVIERPERVRWYADAVDGERGWAILGRDETITWPPATRITPTDLLLRRADHTPPIGWAEGDPQGTRRAAASLPEVIVFGDDALSDMGLGDALGEMGIRSRGPHLQ